MTIVGVMKAALISLALTFPMTLLAEPVVSLAGLQVVYDSGENEFDGFKVFNQDQGHAVTLMVRSDGKPLIGFDEDNARLTIGGARAKCRFFSGMGYSKDHKALKIEFTADATAKPSADGSLEIRGTVPVTLASGKAMVKSQPFPVQKGAVLVFPEGEDLPKLKIKSIGKPQFGRHAQRVEFSTDTKMDGFAAVRFTTADGAEIESERNGSSWMGFGGTGSGEVDYSFAKKQTELIMVLETWTGREEKNLAVDLKARMAVK